MKRILKYALKVQDGPQKQSISVHASARPISVISQGNEIMVYCEVHAEDDVANYKRDFIVVGTGWEFNDLDTWGFIGTVQIGQYVWHVYNANP